MLGDAGVIRIQPGIESMNDHVLKLMRKGTSALRNIQLLKWCKEYGIAVDWNLLYGFPGETQADYNDMMALLPAIRFLGLPHACSPIRLDRFSPHFDLAAEFGLTNLQPIAPYRFLYPFDSEVIAGIAYYFDFDYRADVDPRGYASAVIQLVDFWRHQPETGTLTSISRSDGTLLLLDSRSDAAQPEHTLAVEQSAVYHFCDTLRSVRSVLRFLDDEYPEENFSEKSVRDFLDWLVANRLMVTDGTHFLSLAIPTKTVETINNSVAVASLGDAKKRSTLSNGHDAIELTPIASLPDTMLP